MIIIEEVVMEAEEGVEVVEKVAEVVSFDHTILFALRMTTSL
jgi:hypothetical protein